MWQYEVRRVSQVEFGTGWPRIRGQSAFSRSDMTTFLL